MDRLTVPDNMHNLGDLPQCKECRMPITRRPHYCEVARAENRVMRTGLAPATDAIRGRAIPDK